MSAGEGLFELFLITIMVENGMGGARESLRLRNNLFTGLVFLEKSYFLMAWFRYSVLWGGGF
jgi:hypothetical protein